MSKKKKNNFNEHIKSENQNDANDCFEVAEAYYAQKNYSEAFKWYNKAVASKNPNPVAYFNIAYAWQFGEGTYIDLAQAFEFYEKAAVLELPQALYNLAFFYQNGIIVPRDEEKAVRLCREATLKLNEMRSKLYSLQLEYEKLTDHYHSSLRLIDDTNGRFKFCENRISQIEDENKILQQKNNSLNDEVIKYKNQIQNISNQNSMLSSNNQKMEAQLKYSDETISNKDILINSLHEHISELQKNNDDISNKYLELNHLVEELRGENKAFSITLKNNELEQKNVSMHNSQLLEQLMAKEKDFNELMNQYRSIIENYNRLNSNFEIEKKAKKDAELQVRMITKEKNQLAKVITQKNSDYSKMQEFLNGKISELTRLKLKLSIVAGFLGAGFGITLLISLYSYF